MELWIPVFLGLGSVWYLALAAEPPAWIAPLGAVAGGLVAARWRKNLAVLAPALAVTAVSLGFAMADWRTARVAAPVIKSPLKFAEIEGVLLGATRRADGSTRIVIAPWHISRLEADVTPARVRINVRTQMDDVMPGDTIAVAAGLMPPPGPVAPGAFDFSRQVYFKRIGAVGYALGPVRRLDQMPDGAAVCLRFCVSRLRAALTQRIMSSLPPPQGAVAAALMTGDRGSIPEPVLQNLRDAGLAHLLAISGLHMALFAGALFWAVRAGLALVPGLALQAPVKKWAAGAALAGAFGYLLVSGASVATQRAFVMFALIFIAVMTDRPAITLRNVALAAVIVLLLTPEAVLEASFQMSFSAAAALVAFYETARPWVTHMSQAAVERGWMARAGLYIGGIALTSIVASLATAPFAAIHFNRVVDFGLVANLAALPLIGFVVMPAALTAFIAMPVGLEGVPLWVAGQGISAILWVAEYVAAWPGAVTLVPAMPPATLGAMALGGLWLIIWKGHARWFGLAGPAFGIALAIMAPEPALLIDRDAKVIAIRMPDGSLALSGARAGKFSAQTWLRRDADRRTPSMAAAAGFSCDDGGCVATFDGGGVSLTRTWRAAMEDCQWADVLVAPLYLPRNCSAPLSIDRGDLTRLGAHAVYLEQGEEGTHMRVETACDHIGARPWSTCPPSP